MSTDYDGLRAEIKTVDAQESLNSGVLVLVTGYLTGKDNVRRNFTQSFFLATQDKGYFVLNDMLRYVEEADQQGDQGLANDIVAPLPVEQGIVRAIYCLKLCSFNNRCHNLCHIITLLRFCFQRLLYC